MLNWFLSTSVLIAVVLLLRRVLRDKIDPRLTYALWLLAALRICIPGSLFTAPVSVSGLAEDSGLTEAVEEVRYTTEHETTYSASTGSYNDDTSALEETDWFQRADWFGYRGVTDVHIVDKQEVTAAEAGGNPESDGSFARLELEITRDRFFSLRVIWFAGMAVIALWFVFTNLRFRLHLHRSALPAQVDSPLPVRVMPDLVSPCLCGLLRPAIYVTPDCLTDETRLRHVLTHELTHHRHKDHWWAVVRCACLIVQWFNPLVWLAAYLSRQDCELACDASVIRVLGEDQRLSYGKTLVDMIAATRTPGALLQTATTMTGGKKSIAQRIQLIVKRPKMTVVTLISVLLIAALAVGCTFGGATEADAETALPEEWYGEYYTAEIVAVITDDTFFSDTNFHVFVTSDYFAYEYTSGDSIHSTSLMSPKYERTDIADTVYLVMDRFSPYADDFASVAEAAKAYSVSESSQLLVLDNALWLAFNIDTDRPVIHRLTTEEPVTAARQYLDQTDEDELFTHFFVATLANREYASTADLTSDDLFRMAVLAAGEMAWYDEAAGHYVIPISDLTGVLDTYLASYQFDPAQVSYGQYNVAADTITATALGFGTGMSDYSFKSASAVDAQTLRVCLSDAYSQDVVITAAVTESGVKFLSSVRAATTLPNTTEEYLTSLVINMEISMREPNSFTFSDPKELSATQLYTLFVLLTDYEILEQCYHAEEELFYFTGDFITAQLEKYFRDFHFDITQHEKYDSGADAIVTPIASGFGGDRYTKMTSLTESDSIVTFTLEFYDNYELTGTPYQVKEYTIEFYDGGYYYRSAREVTPAELAQSVYAAIVGDYTSRDCYMEIYDNRSGSGGTTTRIHITEENSWNLPNTIGKYEFSNPNDASRYEWSFAEPCLCATPLALTLISADGKTTLSCYEGCDAVILNINGEYYLLTAKVSDDRSSSFALFHSLLRAAEDALIHEAYHIIIDGSITDYEKVVEEYARRYAENLNALPSWHSDKPEDVVYRTSSVSQAYFGEGTENFCGGFGLYFSPEMGNSDWQAGSGMDQETEGEYAGWWKWGIGADFARNEEGDWTCTGTYTGGESLTYPTPLEEATPEQMVYYFYHTIGFAHDYLIPYYICQQPVSALDELNRLLNTADVPHDLCAALGAFLRDYGDYDDIRLTYEVLSNGLASKFRPCLEEGYTGIPE